MEAQSGSNPIAFRSAVWRDFLRLAVEGVTIGLFVSAVLGLAVMVIASQSPSRERAPVRERAHSAFDRGGPGSGLDGQPPAARFLSA